MVCLCLCSSVTLVLNNHCASIFWANRIEETTSLRSERPPKSWRQTSTLMRPRYSCPRQNLQLTTITTGPICWHHLPRPPTAGQRVVFSPLPVELCLPACLCVFVCLSRIKSNSNDDKQAYISTTWSVQTDERFGPHLHRYSTSCPLRSGDSCATEAAAHALPLAAPGRLS